MEAPLQQHPGLEEVRGRSSTIEQGNQRHEIHVSAKDTSVPLISLQYLQDHHQKETVKAFTFLCKQP